MNNNENKQEAVEENLSQSKKKSKTIKTKDLSLMALFVALIAVGAFIKIPLPLVPVTLQFAFCILSGLILGCKKGTLCVLIYIFMGLIGLPIFTSGGGFSYVLYPTFGYMIGFVLASFLSGFIAKGWKGDKKPKLWIYFVASFSAILVEYAIGLPYLFLIKNFYLGTTMSVWNTIKYGCLLFLPTDTLWCIVSALIGFKINKLNIRK